jgi:hypothetical protein
MEVEGNSGGWRTDDFVRSYAMKWGDEAAAYRLRMRKCTLFIGVPAIFLGLFAFILPIGVAVRLGLMAAFFVCGMALCGVILVLGKRMNRAASETLCIPIGWKAVDSPPVRSPAYEHWCESKGLRPYSASQKYPPSA